MLGEKNKDNGLKIVLSSTDGNIANGFSHRKEAKTMREILFRGKRLDNGEWVYGSFLQVEHEDGSFTTAIFQKKDAGGFSSSARNHIFSAQPCPETHTRR